jgi:hypothetical protein
VFVLTHHARAPLVMEGGTTFYFVTDGIESALRQAKEAAGDKDVRIGGGVSTIRQYMAAGLMTRCTWAFAPVLLGEGEHLFNGMNLHDFGFAPFKTIMGENAMHVFLRKCVRMNACRTFGSKLKTQPASSRSKGAGYFSIPSG